MGRRSAAKILAGTLLMLVVGVAGLLAFLDTEAGARFLLEHARSTLAGQGLDVTYAHGVLNLWRGFSFENLHVTFRQPSAEFDVDIKKISVRYQIEWWQRRLDITSAEVIEPRVHGLLRPTASAPAKEGTKDKQTSLALPVDVRVESVLVQDLDVNVDASEAFAVEIHRANFKGALGLRTNDFAGRLQFDLGEKGRVAKDGSWSVGFAGKGDSDLLWVDHRLQIKPSHFDLSLNQIQFAPSKWSARQIDIAVEAASERDLFAKAQVHVHQFKNPRGRSVEARLALDASGSPELSPLDVRYEIGVAAGAPLKGQLHIGNEGQAPAGTTGGPSAAKHVRADLRLELTPALVTFLGPNPPLQANRGARIDLNLDAHVRESAESNARLKLEVPKLKVAGKPWKLGADLENRWDADFRNVGLEGSLLLDMADFGRWKLVPRWTAETREGHTKGETSLLALREPRAFQTEGEFKLTHDVHKSTTGKIDANLSANFPALNIRDVGRAGSGEAHVTVRSQGSDGRNLEFAADLRQGALNLTGRPPLAGWRGEVRGDLKGGEVLRVPRLTLSLDRDRVRFDGEVSANLRRRDLQSKLRLNVDLPQSFPLPGGAWVSGRVDAPFTIGVLAGKEFALDGDLQFQNLSAGHKDVSLGALSGKLPVHERLKWDGRHASFTEVMRENPFERVDFNRVRPLLHGNEQLRLEKITWRDRQYGPFVGFVSLRQNLISLHQFDLDLLAGKAAGEAFLNVQPSSLQVGFLGRLTGLNLTEFLPESFLGRLDRRTRDLSARAGVIFNLNRASLEGRVDVTEIGGRQLVALINVLDPEARDEKMNKLRSLLQVGYPSAVRAGLAEGFMDLDVDVRLLGLTSRQQIHSVPLSGLIGKYTRGWVLAAAKGILK